MSKTITPTSSKTDWARIDAMTDDDIDTSGDSPAMGREFFAKARLRRPGDPSNRARIAAEAEQAAQTQPVTVPLEMEPTLLAWFQAQGEDYPQRMLAALRFYALAHTPAAP